ncbi:MAG: hypothetical protein L0H12_06910, partial [Nitrosospira sp.]|nr:hypothetical protein [Nitrosospira sp.]
GNVALKTSEGVAQMLSTYLREEFSRNSLTRFAGLIALPVINAFKRRVDHRQYNGASLLGLRGIVIKSHGSADSYAFGFAIARAVDEVRGGMLRHISERVAALPHRPGGLSSYHRSLPENVLRDPLSSRSELAKVKCK